MRLSRILLTAVACVCCAASAAAQQQPTCKLKISDAPALRGFRLGMSLAEVRALVPNIRVVPGALGHSRADANFQAGNSDPARFGGVAAVFLELIDERVTGLSVAYDPSVRWENTDQFLAKVSEHIRLPAAWAGDSTREMTCDGFKISVSPNHISLSDASAPGVLRRRQAEDEERKRQSFKP